MYESERPRRVSVDAYRLARTRSVDGFGFFSVRLAGLAIPVLIFFFLGIHITTVGRYLNSQKCTSRPRLVSVDAYRLARTRSADYNNRFYFKRVI